MKSGIGGRHRIPNIEVPNWDVEEMSENEAALVERDVDRNPDAHRATEPDEEQILRELYGEPDADGVFRGEAA
ncbi:hypothetical protein GCM10010191_67820 [Actinomadura vinacea]|uniref:Uncharacterized protein n=1 Tax=Actinomadura vinacea TaxID=115336 RepID=A0ABN3JW19_9ACTN